MRLSAAATSARLLAVTTAALALDPVVHIEWTQGPDRPVGTQDSAFGILNDNFVVSLGNRGVQHAPPYGPGAAKMWNGGHRLPVASGSEWVELPASPATTLDRGKPGYSVNNAAVVQIPPALGGGMGLITAGGFAHHACNKETVLLHGENWTYTKLPDFPYDNELASVAAVNSTVFAIGGSNCPKGHEHADGSVWVDNVGAKVWMLNLAELDKGWQQGPTMPGTPRLMHTAALVGRYIYVLGGQTTAINLTAKRPEECETAENCGATVVDNWKLDTETLVWSRLPNMPAEDVGSAGCTTSGFAVWRDRYVLCLGTVYNPYTIEHPSVSLKKAGGEQRQLNKTCNQLPESYQKYNPASPAYPNGVTVFDVETQTFGAVTSHGIVPDGCPPGLPVNCFAPQVGIQGDSLWLTGGECDAAIINSKEYWHYPTATFFGRLAVREQAAVVV